MTTAGKYGSLDASSLRPVSLDRYATRSGTGVNDPEAALRTLLANEPHIYIPPGTWQMPSWATPFEPLLGQRIDGLTGGRFSIDPGDAFVSRLKAPSGWSGQCFTGDLGVAHVYMENIFIDLSAAVATNAGDVFHLTDSVSGEEAWWTLRRVQCYGPYGRFFYGGLVRRGVTLDETASFRNGGTACIAAYDMKSTDWLLNNCRGGSANLVGNTAIGVKAYGAVGTVQGGDYWGWGTNIDMGGSGINLLGVRSDRASKQAIFVESGATGLIDDVTLHSNGQDIDNNDPHIKVACQGGVAIGLVHVFQDPTVTNACNYVVQGSGGGWADISRMVINNPQGVGSGVKPVRSGDVSMTQGSLTFGASMTVDSTLVRQRSKIARVTLTAACTPTINAGFDGEVWRFHVIQDATGGWTVTWPANTVDFTTVKSGASTHTLFDAQYDAGSSRWRKIGA